MVGEATQTVSLLRRPLHERRPGRGIPSHHEGLLAYCDKLGVPLEVEINSSRSAYFWSAGSNGGKPIQMRQGVNDTRGYISELLAKALNKGALDQDLTAEDKQKLLPFLQGLRRPRRTAWRSRAPSARACRRLPGAAAQFGKAPRSAAA